ncbi:hypothetical protein QTG56_23960 (plasmid) [Rossellomorea sp. AcN35-11]|nr:hypothetical protein [Rossellomorea aquimaris]WJV31694.1 hypothetical protein QTG56_23960 [Rossellomorea sp. AcN35-11]
MNQIVKNSLFAMVDLFLDYAAGETSDSQRENIVEFIIDCFNLEESHPEYKLLQSKFAEEFEESNHFLVLNEEEVTTMIENSLEKLTQSRDVPPLLSDAIFEVYGAEEKPEEPVTIAWVYMVPAEDGLSIDQLTSLLNKVPKGTELLLLENEEFIEANSVAMGFIDNQHYEELQQVRETVSKVCNDWDNERTDGTYTTANGYKVSMLCNHQTA